jgi:hypothetical protein
MQPRQLLYASIHQQRSVQVRACWSALQVAQAALKLGPSAAGPDYSLDADALTSARTASGATVSDACAEVASTVSWGDAILLCVPLYASC